MAARTRVRKHRNCCGSLSRNIRRSGDANGEDRHVQIRVSDRESGDTPGFPGFISGSIGSGGDCLFILGLYCCTEDS